MSPLVENRSVISHTNSTQSYADGAVDVNYVVIEAPVVHYGPSEYFKTI
jgi:hypothetical protein